MNYPTLLQIKNKSIHHYLQAKLISIYSNTTYT